MKSTLPERQKAAASGVAAEHLGLKREQTMAMGDGENDFSMILEAGIGVAMKNGRPDLCEAAELYYRHK